MNDTTVPRSDSTRPLPARANLEHPKGEAKKRLRDMRRQNRGATLAAAQFAVARSYGFASWRKLKAYVDTLRDAAERLVNAVRTGDLDTMRAVLDRSPELVNATMGLDRRFRPSDTRAMRVIHLAVAENQMEAARILIERGVNLNVRNADGRLPLHDCFELGRDEFAQLLLAAGAEADVCAAAGYGMYDRLREDRSPYDVGAWGPIAHVANLSVARVLLENGANPNCRNKDGDTPIHAAIKSRLVGDPTAFIELLLAAGADRAIVNNDGRTAADEALRQVGRAAETYFPARPIGPKKLERAIELLR